MNGAPPVAGSDSAATMKAILVVAAVAVAAIFDVADALADEGQLLLPDPKWERRKDRGEKKDWRAGVGRFWCTCFVPPPTCRNFRRNNRKLQAFPTFSRRPLFSGHYRRRNGSEQHFR